MENNKPITLAREDFMNDMAMLINQSGLPFFVIEDAMRQMINGISSLAKGQLEQDRQFYQQYLQSCNDNNNE